ncbi:hypothetical protein GOP47_0006722 [Adiantum capillus-veneris]|uniref:Uncharacterized protein n=1 Tax=Adiantum capillus-veneris TaxID=13818 RepID=A0A9D4V3F2_ADICA|nr:hypothetical protein GOP47_0006722 [Adiantum capillus-veneris]
MLFHSLSAKRRLLYVFSEALSWHPFTSRSGAHRALLTTIREGLDPHSANGESRFRACVIMEWDGRGFQASHCRSLSALAFQHTASDQLKTSKEASDQTQPLSHDPLSGVGDAGTPISTNSTLMFKSEEKALRGAFKETTQVKVVQESVQSLEDLVKELETSVPEGDPKIGALCLRLAQLCILKDEDPEKILLYGQRAMKILGTPEISLECATCLETIGFAHCKKGEFEKSVSYLERAAFILDKLKATLQEEEMGSLQFAVQALLGQANMSLGREEEALVNFQDALSVNEKVLDASDPNLGKSYHQIAQAFMRVQDLHKALALCLKAVPIYTKSYGPTSLQVAELRKLLSVIYYGLDEFENVLSEHEIVRPIFEGHGKSVEVASLDLAAGEALLCLDRYTKAISKLKDVIKQTAPVSHCHGQALVLLAKAYAYSKKVKGAKTHSKKALEVLRNKESSLEVGASSVELALVFRQLDETEQALSTFKTSLEIYKKYPSEQAAIAFIEGQIGLIYLSTGRTLEALPYLETCLASNAVGLKEKELLDVYNQLGGAYIQLGKLDQALAKFEAGRIIAEQSNFDKDPALISLYHSLASLYRTLGRFEDALSRQQQLVKLLKKTGPQTEIGLEDAEKRLEELLQEVDKSQQSRDKQN